MLIILADSPLIKYSSQTEARMEEACAASQEHQEDLERELLSAQDTLAELQSEHQLTEKSLRMEK